MLKAICEVFVIVRTLKRISINNQKKIKSFWYMIYTNFPLRWHNDLDYQWHKGETKDGDRKKEIKKQKQKKIGRAREKWR